MSPLIGTDAKLPPVCSAKRLLRSFRVLRIPAVSNAFCFTLGTLSMYFAKTSELKFFLSNTPMVYSPFSHAATSGASGFAFAYAILSASVMVSNVFGFVFVGGSGTVAPAVDFVSMYSP